MTVTDPSLLLQGAINTALRNDETVGSYVDDRIYDHVPMEPMFPYITIGSAQVIENSSDCSDRYEVFQDIHVWSKAVGFPEVKTICHAVRKALATISLGSERLVWLNHENTRYLKERDTGISHGIISYEAMIEAVN